MTQSQEYELHVLNELIVATLDRAHDYREAAAKADASLASTFAHRAREHIEAAEHLNRQVRALRGKPASSTSILGAAYSALARNDDQGIDDEITQQCFEKALNDIRISDLVRSVIYAARARIDDAACLPTNPVMQ